MCILKFQSKFHPKAKVTVYDELIFKRCIYYQVPHKIKPKQIIEILNST